MCLQSPTPTSPLPPLQPRAFQVLTPGPVARQTLLAHDTVRLTHSLGTCHPATMTNPDRHVGETASTWSACVGNVRQTALPCLASTTTAHGSQQHRGRCWGPQNRGPWPVLGVPKNQKNLQKDVPSWSHAERPIREGKSFRGLFGFLGP